MPAPKRSRIQREQDLVKLADLYLKGWPQQKIADELGVGRTQVIYDLHTIFRRWREDANRDVGEFVARELAKLDRLEAEYWDGWERSVKKQVETHQAQKEGGVGGQPERSVRRVERERDGNPTFLDGVLRCIDRRCKLLGLDAPEQVDLTLYVREKAMELGLDPEEAIREAESVLRGTR